MCFFLLIVWFITYTNANIPKCGRWINVFFFRSKIIDFRIKMIAIHLHREYYRVIVQQKCPNASILPCIYAFWHILSCNFSQSRFALCCIYVYISFCIRILYIYSLPFALFSRYFNTFLTMHNTQFLVFRLDPSSWFSVSIHPLSFSLLFGSPFFHLFTYLPRQGNSSCKHTSSKKLQTAPIRPENTHLFSRKARQCSS